MTVEELEKEYQLLAHMNEKEHYHFLFLTWLRSYLSRSSFSRVAGICEAIPILTMCPRPLIESTLILIDYIRADHIAYSLYMLKVSPGQMSKDDRDYMEKQFSIYHTVFDRIEMFESQYPAAVYKHERDKGAQELQIQT